VCPGGGDQSGCDSPRNDPTVRAARGPCRASKSSTISYQLSAPLFLLFSILLRVALLLLQTGVVSFAVVLCFAILHDVL
jgi:hypothetical protein